ncbi:hypothetical protein ACLOJK_033513 [Asimina triloba]
MPLAYFGTYLVLEGGFCVVGAPCPNTALPKKQQLAAAAACFTHRWIFIPNSRRLCKNGKPKPTLENFSLFRCRYDSQPLSHLLLSSRTRPNKDYLGPFLFFTASDWILFFVLNERVVEMVTVAAAAGGEGPCIGLGLGIGSAVGLENGGKSAFTFLQLQELEHQALIFKYMVAGVPVPFHLVLPIWKSVASSVGVGAGVFKHYPSCNLPLLFFLVSFLSLLSLAGLGCGNLCFDYRNSMEPEPGRCRRTDGKKWRCSKDVVPDQKYCERHMHRGRQRSRKPVEGNNNSTVSATAMIKPSADSNTSLSISIAGGLQLMTTSNTPTAIPVAATAVSSTNTTGNVSPRLGFSPNSVLQANAAACKTESSF